MKLIYNMQNHLLSLLVILKVHNLEDSDSVPLHDPGHTPNLHIEYSHDGQV